METIWIIGAGKFGIRTTRWLLNKEQGFDVTLVDQDHDSLVQAEKLGCRVEAGDGVSFLYEQLTRDVGPNWIVPAVPVHLAWEWCRLYLSKERLSGFQLPQDILDLLPNPMNGAKDIYVSHADFLCPPNCNEPDDRCTKTGKSRKQDMFTLLAEVDYEGILPIVIQSVQLGPGVGGYRPGALFDLADRICLHQGPFFAATACRCHGVISGGQIR